jgi:hypothetical protein
MTSRLILDISRKIFIDKRTWEWCQLPYPGHPKGCPNYDHKIGCPPNSPFINEVADMNKSFYFAIVVFNLENHVKNMQIRHPSWSYRQLSCCLYWQGGVKRELKETADAATRFYPGTVHILCPEAMGVNVFRTLKFHGMTIETRPKMLVSKVALVYYPLIKEIK